jgi:hypothetical protein
MFGNTEVIARQVGAGLAVGMPVDIVEVGSAPTEIGADVALLIVGGPTHAFGMSRPQTRADATKQASGHVVSQGRGIREWLDEVTCSAPVAAIAFDTRVKKNWLPGSAAKAAQKRLQRMGFTTPEAPQSFYVEGTPGLLLEGELERARAWGERVSARLVQTPRQ